ncbi:MAG TPA: glycosyltransferase family 2 protein [Candidatus Acidoferrum sp.]|nr:glycosyltransferase family 2 protein [Candidatus Acidoferrum sp.]
MKLSGMALIFWTCIFAVAYNYVGYPLVLFALSVLSQAKSDLSFLLRRTARRQSLSLEHLPPVAVLISAYNEEAVIQAKVKNSLDLDYPQDLLEIIIGLDAPTDTTAGLLAQLQSSQIRVVHFSERRGKLGVLSSLAQQTSAEILVVTDANTILERNCIRNLMRHFTDPKVGAVSGEETRVVVPGTDPAAESLYWKYESALKFLENRLNCTLGGNGGVLALRRALFRPSKQSIIEDFQIPLEIRLQGYRVVYDPEAIAIEEIAPTAYAQSARRVRIATGGYQTLFANLECLDPRRGLLAFCFFSHKVLRWLTPLLLLVAFFCSALLIKQPGFATLLAVQCAFYLSAYAGYRLKKRGKPASLFSAPLHFCTMNGALLLGFLRYLKGHRKLTWIPTARAAQPDARLLGLSRKAPSSSRGTPDHAFKPNPAHDARLRSTSPENLGAV